MEPYGSMGTSSGGNSPTVGGGNGGGGSGLGRDARESVRREGVVGRAIERRTTRLRSDRLLWAAGASIVASAVIQLLGARRRGRFDRLRATPVRRPIGRLVGMLAPSLLLLGIYRKTTRISDHLRDVG